MSTHAENVAAYRALQANRRDSLIAAAVKTRKIAPDRAEDFKRMYDADPTGIGHLLTAPGRAGRAAGRQRRGPQPAPAAGRG